jgi:D-glycero-D-manno-heptose 1,7-bisphosphate phosphatase
LDKTQIFSAKLAIFDIDGTITEIKPEIKARKPRMVTPNTFGEQQPIPGVVEGLEKLSQEGVPIALATNRGGVAFGYNSLEEAESLAQEAADLCGIPDAKIYVCPYHEKARGPRANLQFARKDDCRKPNPGMLNQALADFGISPEQAFFVGDKDTDQQAAESLGMHFFWADEFFQLF